MLFLTLEFPKARKDKSRSKEFIKYLDGVGVLIRVEVGVDDGTSSGSNPRGTIIFN